MIPARVCSAATIAPMDDHARGSVLVVDDEPTIAEVVARYLERAGYRTRVAGDGVEVLVARDGREVAQHLSALTPARARAIGARALARIRAEHTYSRRADLVHAHTVRA